MAQQAGPMAQQAGPRIYCCCKCQNRVSLHEDVVSKAFQDQGTEVVHKLLATSSASRPRSPSIRDPDMRETRPGIPVFPCHEHRFGAERGQASHDRPPHRRRRLLQGMSGGARLEVRESLRGDAEVQGREVHPREIKDCEGGLVGTPDEHTRAMDLTGKWPLHM